MPEQPTCGGCKWWEAVESLEDGTVVTAKCEGCYMLTAADHWCGEHAPKPEAGGKAER